MDHVRAMRDALAPHDSPERLERAGVEVIIGHGRFVGPGRIAVGERELRCRTAVIATGSRPILPAGPGGELFPDWCRALTRSHLGRPAEFHFALTSHSGTWTPH